MHLLCASCQEDKEEPDPVGVIGELTVLVACFRGWCVALFRKQSVIQISDQLRSRSERNSGPDWNFGDQWNEHCGIGNHWFLHSALFIEHQL